VILNTKSLMLALLFSLLTACATGGSDRGLYRSGNLNGLASAKAHTDLGAVYLQQNKLDIALSEFEKAIEASPTYALAYNGLAMVRSALNQDKQAEENFKKSLRLDPASSLTYNNYGAFLCSRARYDESIAQFLTAVENPLYKTPHLAYANAGIPCSMPSSHLQIRKCYGWEFKLHASWVIGTMRQVTLWNCADGFLGQKKRNGQLVENKRYSLRIK